MSRSNLDIFYLWKLWHDGIKSIVRVYLGWIWWGIKRERIFDENLWFFEIFFAQIEEFLILNT